MSYNILMQFTNSLNKRNLKLNKYNEIARKKEKEKKKTLAGIYSSVHHTLPPSVPLQNSTPVQPLELENKTPHFPSQLLLKLENKTPHFPSQLPLKLEKRDILQVPVEHPLPTMNSMSHVSLQVESKDKVQTIPVEHPLPTMNSMSHVSLQFESKDTPQVIPVEHPLPTMNTEMSRVPYLQFESNDTPQVIPVEHPLPTMNADMSRVPYLQFESKDTPQVIPVEHPLPTMNTDMSRVPYLQFESNDTPQVIPVEHPLPTMNADMSRVSLQFESNDTPQADPFPTLNTDRRFYEVPPKNITNVTNVYQPFYKASNTTANGFGDFIRGCYFLLVYCDEHNLTFNMDINHPIQNHLATIFSPTEQYIYNAIKFTNKHNLLYTQLSSNKLVGHVLKNNNFSINDVPCYNKTAFVCTTMFPQISKVTNLHIEKIRTILAPSKKMKDFVNEKMELLNYKSKDFQVIHVRCGDSYSNTNTGIRVKLLDNILNWYDTVPRKSNNVLLIADNPQIKNMLSNKIPFLAYLDVPICHSGEGRNINATEASYTMLDFYLMSHALTIHSFTTYGHGSGFSQWCAFTYDIPYTCTICVK